MQIFAIIKIIFFLIGFKKFKMKKILRIKCRRYKKLVKPKLPYVCYKTLLLSSICNKCGSEDEKIFMEQESIKY